MLLSRKVYDAEKLLLKMDEETGGTSKARREDGRRVDATKAIDAAEDQKRRAERRRKVIWKAGLKVDVCIGCASNDVSTFQLDHIAGRKHDDQLWPLCGKCHQEKTDMYYEEPAPTDNPRNPLEVIGRWLLAIAQYFDLLILKLRAFGTFLIELARQGYGSEFELPA